ncbi:MAG: hypothetical protein LBR26_17265 [Prevotella sp.]|jgi:hypothetical protein|nr:hypothetical protein [Prevotella sp.]
MRKLKYLPKPAHVILTEKRNLPVSRTIPTCMPIAVRPRLKASHVPAQYNILGEINMPGNYVLSGLSSAMNACDNLN